MIYVLAGYMFLFVHRPFEIWPWLGTVRIERLYMLCALLWWITSSEKQLINNKLTVSLTLLALSITTSSIIGAYAPDLSTNMLLQHWLKLAVFYILVVTTVRDERSLRFLITAFLSANALYMLHSLREFYCGHGQYRMGVWRMVGVGSSYADPNSFAATLVYALPMVYPLWGECRAKSCRLALIGYSVVTLLCVLLTGSRSSLCALIFLFAVVTCVSPHRLKLIAAYAVLVPIVWNSLRPDLRDRYLTIVDSSYGPRSAQVSAEGRIEGFRDGVRLWRLYPFFGVGPAAFRKANETGMQPHNLYGQVLGELGTFGAIALMATVCGFVGSLLTLKRLRRNNPKWSQGFLDRVIKAANVTVMLLLLDGLTGHNLYRYTWLWFGAFQVVALHCLEGRAETHPDACTPNGHTLVFQRNADCSTISNAQQPNWHP